MYQWEWVVIILFVFIENMSWSQGKTVFWCTQLPFFGAQWKGWVFDLPKSTLSKLEKSGAPEIGIPFSQEEEKWKFPCWNFRAWSQNQIFSVHWWREREREKERERERRRERERETVMASFASSFGRVLKRDLVGIAKAAAFFYVIHEHVVEIAYVSHWVPNNCEVVPHGPVPATKERKKERKKERRKKRAKRNTLVFLTPSFPLH